jgi:SAM-dependent methyltransferase
VRLQEWLTGSQHQHLGYFEAPGDTLTQAQDRLIQRALRFLPRGSRVVDVGSGLGGATRILAAAGLQVLGVDPCAASVAYARARVPSPRTQFLEASLAAFAARARGARFDAVLLTEVLPELGELPAVLACLRALLRPGGILVVHDLVRAPSAPPALGRFHARGALAAAAGAAGLDLVEWRDGTQRAVPTVARLLRALAEREAELALAAGPLAADVPAYRAGLRALEAAFAGRELYQETSVLRCSARLGQDSVVLRPAAGARSRAPGT